MIMCTLTPAQIAGDTRLVQAMYEAGMDAVRINTAHLQGVEQLHLMASKLKEMCPGIFILIDTKGPEMRITAIAHDGSVKLTEGMEVRIMGTSDDTDTSAECIYVNYPDLHSEVKASNELMIDDGKIVLRVTGVSDGAINAAVTTGGDLGSRKGLSVAGVDINLPAVSRHDREFIRYAATSEYVDVVAHSFVRCAADVIAVREAMSPGSKPIIAKIENHQGLDNLSDIIRVSDGILIARGDLTACIGRAAVPQAQARIASATKAAGLPLYLATNILSSMMYSPTPSDDNIAGISLAVSQGVDVMLLTNETAAGAYPLECVMTLKAAI